MNSLVNSRLCLYLIRSKPLWVLFCPSRDDFGPDVSHKECDASFYDKLFELQPIFSFIETFYKKIPKERANVGKPTPRVHITVSFEDSWYSQPLKDGEEGNFDNWKSHKGKFPDPTGVNGSCIVPHKSDGKKEYFFIWHAYHFCRPQGGALPNWPSFS